MESKKVTLSSQVCIICSLTPIKITFFYPYAIILKNYAFSYCWASFESCPFKFSVGHVFCLVTSLLPYMEEEENIAFFQQMAVSHHFPASPLTRPLRCFFLFDCVPHECLNPCVCVSICARFRVYVVYSTKLGAVVRKRRTLLPRRTVLQWFVSCVVFVQNMKIFLLFFLGETHIAHTCKQIHTYTRMLQREHLPAHERKAHLSGFSNLRLGRRLCFFTSTTSISVRSRPHLPAQLLLASHVGLHHPPLIATYGRGSGSATSGRRAVRYCTKMAGLVLKQVCRGSCFFHGDWSDIFVPFHPHLPAPSPSPSHGHWAWSDVRDAWRMSSAAGPKRSFLDSRSDDALTRTSRLQSAASNGEQTMWIALILFQICLCSEVWTGVVFFFSL